MNKTKTVIIVVLIIVAVVAILAWNKMKMAKNAEIETFAHIPVVVTTPMSRHLSDSLSLVGTTVAYNDVALAAETQGKVKEIFVSIGDHVAAGSPIVKVDDELKQAAFETAEVNYMKAKRDLDRFEALHQDSTVSDAQIESARLAYKSAEAQYIVAKRQLNDTRICSPISGIVTNRIVDVGSMIQNGMIVANICDISRLKVKVNVAERDVFTMNAGDPVQVTTEVYPGVVFTGSIISISAKGDELHTYPVEISLANPPQNPLKAGMFVRVSFAAKTERSALVIPRSALIGSIKQPRVFVVENNIAYLRSLTIGAESESAVEVLSGLEGNEQIVTEGKNNLKDGYKVTITKQSDENTK